MASTGSGTQAQPDADLEGESSGYSNSRRGLLLGGVVLLAMLGMWAWIFTYHMSGSWRGETPGRMDDRVFGDLAENVCSGTEARLAALPPAFEADDAAERADVVALSNVELSTMLDELSGLPVATEHDQGMVSEWLVDWRQYVADRDDYVNRLRSDETARFYVTQSDRDEVQITEGIDRFAALNDMPACMVPEDLS